MAVSLCFLGTQYYVVDRSQYVFNIARCLTLQDREFVYDFTNVFGKTSDLRENCITDVFLDKEVRVKL